MPGTPSREIRRASFSEDLPKDGFSEAHSLLGTVDAEQG
jgi:hypothetical protein